MKKDYFIRLYQPGDEEEIVELLQLVFNGWPNFDLKRSSIEHWKWKYLDNLLKQSLISVGSSNGKIIGVNHALPVKVKIGDNIILGAFTGDTGVHPEYRKIGVYNKMIDQIKDDINYMPEIKFFMSVTSNPVIIKNNLRRNIPRFPYKITNLVRIKDIDLQLKMIPMSKSWIFKTGFYLSKLGNKFKKNLFKFKPSSNGELQISEIQSFDDKINVFSNIIMNSYDFILERNQDYLNWRYCDNRAGNFNVFIVEDEKEQIIGYCALYINRHVKDYSIGYIVELLTIPNRLDAADALITNAVEFFDDKNINIVNYLMIKGNPLKKILNKYDFLDSRYEIQLFMRTREKNYKLGTIELYTPAKVHFSYGDIDSLPTQIPLARSRAYNYRERKRMGLKFNPSHLFSQVLSGNEFHSIV